MNCKVGSWTCQVGYAVPSKAFHQSLSVSGLHPRMYHFEQAEFTRWRRLKSWQGLKSRWKLKEWGDRHRIWLRGVIDTAYQQLIKYSIKCFWSWDRVDLNRFWRWCYKMCIAFWIFSYQQWDRIWSFACWTQDSKRSRSPITEDFQWLSISGGIYKGRIWGIGGEYEEVSPEDKGFNLSLFELWHSTSP